MIQKQSYQIRGMRQDNLVNTNNSRMFAHEIMNMRLNTINDYTTTVWTTERGTLNKTIEWDNSYNVDTILNNIDTTVNPIVPIGQAVINNTWIVFATQTLLAENDPNYTKVGYDFIFKYWYKDGTDILKGTVLYLGNLNFDAQHPCETLTSYENEVIQKVYWTDGKNQPRVINIVKGTNIISTDINNIDGQFDFVQEVSLKEEVTVTKRTDGAGVFPPSTVKYALTYYKKYGQETNIIYDSPLYYPIKDKRGCSPDELSGDSFEIRVNNVDVTHNFDYIRLYSIIRTSENATPIVRIVADKEIISLPFDENNNRYALFVDTNTTGEIIDPTILQYLGGREIVAQTFNQKSNTLFLGNIELKTKSIAEALNHYNKLHDTTYDIEIFRKDLANNCIFKLDDTKQIKTREKSTDNQYSYINQLSEVKKGLFDVSTKSSFNGNSLAIKIFKYAETYRFGIQFQDKKANWSDVVWLCDRTNDVLPELSTNIAKFATLQYTITKELQDILVEEGFYKARIVCCYPNNSDRTFLAQGVLNPTIKFPKLSTDTNTEEVVSSWFFRQYQNGAIVKPDVTESQNNFNFEYSENIYTINSPEIEFDETIRTLDSSGVGLKQIGQILPTFYSSTYYVEAGSPMVLITGFRSNGFIKNISKSIITNSLREIGVAASYWEDVLVYNWDQGRANENLVKYELFPFHRKGSLNDYEIDIEQKVSTYASDSNKNPKDFTIKESAKLNSKVFANIIYSKNNNYLDKIRKNATPINDFQIIDTNEVIPTKVDGTIYYGNVDTILPIDNENYDAFEWEDKANKEHSIYGSYNLKKYPEKSYNNQYSKSSAPVTLTYNSTTQGVFSCVSPLKSDLQDPNLLIVDIVKNVQTDTRFGGKADDTTIYIPCGPSTDLRNNSSNIIIKGIEGDHYYMRYDCLKTYPRTPEDINQIVEILSFMCETRINLDGRYDKNRGLDDNTTITNTNFNLINKSYTQSNNFFTYKSLTKEDSSLSNFSNIVTWTKPKVLAEDIDTWTNITLASTADLDGTCGKLNKIINYNGNLIAFQDHAISSLGFDEKTAISTESGLPLEISNSGKFSGIKYETQDIGCQNKWSISVTKNGIMFIDDSRQELMLFGQTIESLSTKFGFDSFFIQQLPKSEYFKPWTPYNSNNFVTYYDKLSNDIFYINRDYCLAWNEQSQTFTSFYSYNNIPYMTNIGTHSLIYTIDTISNNIWAARESDSYSSFFRRVEPYWITIVCDGQTDDGSAFPADKVFNNIEYRADMFNPNGLNSIINESIFNKKAAWNGYQMYKEFDIDAIRKFNIWRVQLPRATYNRNGIITTTRDRIRNPFCYIKLLNDNPNKKNRAVLHDLAVTFDIR